MSTYNDLYEYLYEYIKKCKFQILRLKKRVIWVQKSPRIVNYNFNLSLQYYRILVDPSQFIQKTKILKRFAMISVVAMANIIYLLLQYIKTPLCTTLVEVVAQSSPLCQIEYLVLRRHGTKPFPAPRPTP